MEKCRYYNNHQTCASLMVDDVSPVAIFTNGQLTPQGDWGYGLNKPNSLYDYLEHALFQRFPEIRGTLFLPILKHGAMAENSGWDIRHRDFKPEFMTFLSSVQNRFDLAFHGSWHTTLDETTSPTFQNCIQEFQEITAETLPTLKSLLVQFTQEHGITFSGGKSPGYLTCKEAEFVFEELGFLWWARSVSGINRKDKANTHQYFGKKRTILDVPTNISGDLFRRRGNILKRSLREGKNEAYLEYLLQNELPITIQEHYMGLKSDGKRQTPNLFDDLCSLEKIYDFLRGKNIWHCTCSQLAQYRDSYDNSTIESKEEGHFCLTYHGQWKKLLLSVKSHFSKFRHKESGQIIQGIFKEQNWVFNDLAEGTYIRI